MGNTSAKHQSSTSRPKKNVHWKTAETPSPPGKPVLVHATDETDPDVVTLKWERPRTDGGSPLYGYYVEHRRTGSPQWVNSTPALILYPEVVLTGLEPGWRYQFRVTAENAVGTSAYSELSEPLTVSLQRHAAAAAPRFVTELPATQTVIENDKVEFHVTLAGQPPPQVNWFKDGFEVFSSRRTKIVTENSSSTLIIHQTALTDEGEIKCTATNRLGHVVGRAALRIEAPPKIRLPRQYEDGLLIEADEVVRLKVGLAGRPPPMVVWCHNGEIIRNDADGGHYEVQTSEKNSTLKITNSRRSDRGEYNLRAINQLGDDVVSFLVTVTDRPSRPGKVTVTMSLGKSVTLSWLAPEDDGGCKIGNYVVEYFRLGWNVWLKAVTTRQLSATLSDLIEGSEYKFRVKAESPYGMSDPSEESDVMFVPDPKRGLLNASSTSPARDTLETMAGGDLVSRIPVLTKPPVKTMTTAAATKTAPVAKTSAPKTDKSNDLMVPRSRPGASPNTNKRVPSPKLYDSETIAREMSYGTSNTSDTAVQKETAKMRQTMAQYDQQLLKDMQYENAEDEAAHERKLRREGHVKETMQRPSAAASTPSKPEPAKKHDELHASSEFVLVLYDDQKTKKNGHTEQSSYDPEFESMPPPPLSHSTPELGTEHPVLPKLRRCVSSTEMLYEKAMQRFYKAVELEEDDKTHKAETLKRRSESVEAAKHAPPASHDLPVITRRLGSFGEADLLERRSSLRKRVSTESLTLPAKLRDKHFEPDDYNTATAAATTSSAPPPDADRNLKEEIRESQRRLSEQFANQTPSSSVDYEDDYTESTASSESVDSMEKFRSVIQSISKEKTAEMDTYNPMMSSRTVAASSNVRTITAEPQQPSTSDAADPFFADESPHHLDHFDTDEMIRRSLESTEPEELLSEEEMEEQSHRSHDDLAMPTPRHDEARALSPYRTPAPDQSTIALTRPLPMPSPDFVPKPILKRPSIEDGAAEKPKSKLKSKAEKAEKAEKPEKPGKTDKKGGLLQMFKKATSAEPSTSKAAAAAASVASATTSAVADAVTTKMSAAALAKKKSMERRQSSLEENKVAIDHYSDIVSTIGVTRRPKVPLYLSADELKKGAERDAAQAAAAAAARDSSTGSLSTTSQSSQSQKPGAATKLPVRSPSPSVAIAAANLKESDKRSIFATKLSKDPKKMSLEALPKPPIEFSRSVSVEDEQAAIAPATATPRQSVDAADGGGSKRNSLVRGRTLSTDSTAGKTRSASGTRSRSSSVLRKGGSRDTSQTRAPSMSREPPTQASGVRAGSRTRTPSKSRQQSQSKSPSGRKRTALHVARIGIVDRSGSMSPDAVRSQTPEQLLDEAEQNVRSTMAYTMDVSLLAVASWVYMFNNVWLVMPILALLVYRQVSAALMDKIPKWMKRKRSAKAEDTDAEKAVEED